MSQHAVAYVDIRFCAHATEDLDKVMEAVQNVLPDDVDEDVVFKRSGLEGHYGNPITFFEARVKDENVVQALVEKLASRLSSLDKAELGNNLDRYVEKGSLYIRLDKQAAFQGKIKLVTSDPIRIRVRFRKNKLEDIVGVCRELGMIA